MHPNVQPTNRKKKNFSDYETMSDDDDDDDDESNDEEMETDEPVPELLEAIEPEVLTVEDLVVSKINKIIKNRCTKLNRTGMENAWGIRSDFACAS